MRSIPLAAAAIAAMLSAPVTHGQSFVNWESPHVHPLDLTPDGATLLAVNTADNRLEIFDVVAGGLMHAGSVPVGLDPVSVRARTNGEAWVVNHISDTVSIVDLATRNVRATLPTGDEPADVVFAGAPTRAFVSVSQLNEVRVFDPANLAAAPVVIPIEGEDPRALATDGTSVYAAIFESGNGTTILSENIVSSAANPYPANQNPPPNVGAAFVPPIAGGLPNPPAVSMIVKKQSDGTWRDDNDANWSVAVQWGLHDHDIAVIDAGSLAVSYVSGTMNLNMAMTVAPAGNVVVVGTEADNHVRFEPNVNGTFIRVIGASVTPPAAVTLTDLNPHLDYTTASVSQNLRDQSIGDPRGVAFNAAGDRAFIAGMGSNNLVVTNAALGRVGRVEVGQGPTGVRTHAGENAVYVLNRFEATVSIVDQGSLTETGRVGFYDPTPATITTGRPHLYDTHRTSGLGHTSCASCHIDGRMDQLVWDLGDPSGAVKPLNQVCNFGVGGCENWHPMKGPMATQSLQGLPGTGPLHWRADREDLDAFNGAFESLLGDDAQLTTQEMNEFAAFVDTLVYPPNPFRNMNNTLPTNHRNGGNARTGDNLFNNQLLDAGTLSCSDCHALPTGTNGQLTSAPLIQETQSMKIPQLRNMHEKTGFDTGSLDNNRGFGFTHDGSVDTLFEFLQFSGFTFSGGGAGDQQRRDVVAFLECFSADTHAGVGVQATVDGPGSSQITLRNQMLLLLGPVEIVAKGVVNGEQRGYRYIGGTSFQSDRAAEVVTTGTLDAGAAAGSEITYTVVPVGTALRIGLDRDEDGFFDRDELDACADPADPSSFPGGGPSCACPADITGDGTVNVFDLLEVLAAWGDPGGPADVNGDGVVNVFDLLAVLSGWGAC